ncbi:MAG: hypothetical protein ACPGU5_07390 [Lishizhenia sp.]
MALKINTSKLNKVEPKDAIPVIVKIRTFIFGKKRPDPFTRLVFYVNLVGWFIFMLWSTISYFAIALKDLITENKGISVAAIVRRRGEELGFDGETFLVSFKQFQFADIFIWIAVFVSLIFLYRKKRAFAVIYFSALSLHFLLMVFMLSFAYFMEDVSFFDKIAYLVMVVLSFVYMLLLSKESAETNAMNDDR